MAYIRHIETKVPETFYSQAQVAASMQQWLSDETAQRYIEKIYLTSGIEKRHSVIKNLHSSNTDGFIKMKKDGTLLVPSTKQRNDIYAEACSPLAVNVAATAIENCQEINREDITHVITVSCTGFYCPGADYAIVQQLGLPSSVQRYHLGFMGCYAALPALRMAQQFCAANRHAVVMIVCIELCTLHLKLSNDLDSIISNSIFADGAAAVIVTGERPSAAKTFYEIEAFSSSVLPEGVQDMAWQIGDSGFDMVLSRYVPRIIGANISQLVCDLLMENSMSMREVGTWAIHPGGKSILDSIKRNLALKESQIEHSRDTLRQYGNMSSATILFVLKSILQQPHLPANRKIFAIAFGPGLTVESTMLKLESSVGKAVEKSLPSIIIDAQVNAGKVADL